MADTTSPGTSEAPRIEFVDGMRALAALYVVCHHIWLFVWPIDFNDAKIAAHLAHWTKWLAFGHFSVTAFIVISGFCLGLPMARKGADGWRGAWDFYKRRARRILPPYYASIVLTIILLLTLIGGKQTTLNLPLDFRQVGWSFAMLNNILGVGQVNGVYWSIAVEWQIYLLFPFLVWLWLRYGVAWAMIPATLIGYAVAISTNKTPLQGLTGQYLAMFGLGFCVAHLVHSQVWQERLRRVPWLLIALGLVAFEAIKMRNMDLGVAGSRYWWLDGTIGMATACVLFAGCSGHRIANRALCWRPLLAVGGFSYSLYLMHLPILHLVWKIGIRPLNLSDTQQFLLLFALGLPACIGFAWLFYWAIERHFDPAAARRKRVEVQEPELEPNVEVAGSLATP